jgi:hypothetical protein
MVCSLLFISISFLSFFNLTYFIREKEDVFAFFGEKAEIVDVKILRDKTNGQHKGKVV